MKIPAKFKTKTAQRLLLGYDGKIMVTPCRYEEMAVCLFQRANGSFYLHTTLFDEDGESCGNVKRDISPAQAAAWWTEHFVPPALRSIPTK